MSDGWEDGYWESSKCPLCGSKRHVEVRVKRPTGSWYTTSFCKCLGCTVMFDDPASFSPCRVKADVSVGPPTGLYNVRPKRGDED
jgi:hypothetical protein